MSDCEHGNILFSSWQRGGLGAGQFGGICMDCDTADSWSRQEIPPHDNARFFSEYERIYGDDWTFAQVASWRSLAARVAR